MHLHGGASCTMEQPNELAAVLLQQQARIEALAANQQAQGDQVGGQLNQLAAQLQALLQHVQQLPPPQQPQQPQQPQPQQPEQQLAQLQEQMQAINLQLQQLQQAAGQPPGQAQPAPEEPDFMPQLRALQQRKAAALAAAAAAAPAGQAAGLMRPGKLVKFRGEKERPEEEEPMTFLEWVTQYYAQPGSPERDVLVSYLSGPASTWYTTVAYREAWSHDELLTQLGVRFHNQGRRVQALHQLMKLKQGSMHIAQFNQVFMQLLSASGKLSDSDVVLRYASTCGPDARAVIMRRMLYSAPLATVLQTVQDEVQLHARFGAMVASVGVGARAPEPQQMMQGGPVPMELGAMQAQQRGGNQQRAGGQRAGGQGQSTVKCYECGGRGHVRAQCANLTDPRPGASCFKCSGNGHFARSCSTQERPQQRQQQQQQGGRFGALRNYRPKGANQGARGAN